MHEETSADFEQAWMRERLATPLAHAQWRVWTYRSPAIVLGVSQRMRLAEIERRADPALRVVVRSSGGGAVLVGPWMIGVTVLVPPGHSLAGPGLVESYRWLGELHVHVLHEAGVDARTIGPDEVRIDAARRLAAEPHVQASANAAPLKWACFGALSPWEVVDAGGRKLAGLAQQRRVGGVAFVAGTLLWEPDWTLLCDALGRRDDLQPLRARTTNCMAAARRGTAAAAGGVGEPARAAPAAHDARGRESLKLELCSRLERALAAALS